MAVAFQIKTYTLDTVTRTAVAPPFDCNQINVTQSDGVNNILMETTSGDSTARKTIPVGTEQVVRANPTFNQAFPRDTTVFWLTAVAGTGPAVVEFVR